MDKKLLLLVLKKIYYKFTTYKIKNEYTTPNPKRNIKKKNITTKVGQRKMTDPWMIQKSITKPEHQENSSIEQNEAISVFKEHFTNSLQFEDNFLPLSSSMVLDSASDAQTHNSKLTPLPDSKNYLQSLEKKLRKIQKNPKILDALSEKRAECLRNLLNDNSAVNNDNFLELDAPVLSSDSTVQEICRHIQPVQPLSVGEIIHLVKHDQLEEEQEGNEVSVLQPSVSKPET